MTWAYFVIEFSVASQFSGARTAVARQNAFVSRYPTAFLEVSLGIKPVCLCFNVPRKIKKTSIIIMILKDEWCKGVHTNTLLTLCWKKQHRATGLMILKASPSSLKAIDDKALFPLTNFFPLHPFASLHPHTSSAWLPQTCVIRYTACAPLFRFLAQLKCLKFPGAQIISLTSLKTHEMQYGRLVPLPLSAQTARHFSSIKLPDGQRLPRFTRLCSEPFAHLPLGVTNEVATLLHSEAYAARKPSRQRGALKEQIRILAGK